jgi:hypothetical protein
MTSQDKCSGGSCKNNKCGGYTEMKNADDKSRGVLTNTFNQLSQRDEFKGLTLDNLLNNHTYQTQVVAGTNYKFNIAYGNKYEVVVWHKLDKSHNLTSVKRL